MRCILGHTWVEFVNPKDVDTRVCVKCFKQQWRGLLDPDWKSMRIGFLVRDGSTW